MFKTASTWIIIVTVFVMTLPAKLLQFLVIDFNHRTLGDIYTAWTSIFIHATWFQLILNMSYLIIFLLCLYRLHIILTSLEFLIWYLVPPTMFNVIILYSHFGQNRELFMGGSNSVMVIGGIALGYTVYHMISKQAYALIDWLFLSLLLLMDIFYISPAFQIPLLTTMAHIYGLVIGLLGFVVIHWHHFRISNRQEN